MVARIDIPYNAIFGRLLLNNLCVILSPQYLMIKFEIDKGIASIKGKRVKVKRGYMLVTRIIMKQPKVMILEALEEWDRRKERKAELRSEPINVELKGTEKP